METTTIFHLSAASNNRKLAIEEREQTKQALDLVQQKYNESMRRVYQTDDDLTRLTVAFLQGRNINPATFLAECRKLLPETNANAALVKQFLEKYVSHIEQDAQLIISEYEQVSSVLSFAVKLWLVAAILERVSSESAQKKLETYFQRNNSETCALYWCAWYLVTN